MNSNIIGNKYLITQKIGSGRFGEIFEAINQDDNKKVALKLENIDTKHPQHNQEIEVYNLLNSLIPQKYYGFPKFYEYFQADNYSVISIELLGETLENIFINNEKNFQLKQVLEIGLQMIDLCENFHQIQYIYQDFRPNNLMFGKNENNKLYLIDFAQSKKYIQNDGTHIPLCNKKINYINFNFASINAIKNIEQSRRDDLEQIFYNIIYLLKGKFSWLKDRELKCAQTEEQICEELPIELISYFKYVRSLQFTEQPNYQYLKQLIKTLAERQNIILDFISDYNQKDLKNNQKLNNQ